MGEHRTVEHDLVPGEGESGTQILVLDLDVVEDFGRTIRMRLGERGIAVELLKEVRTFIHGQDFDPPKRDEDREGHGWFLSLNVRPLPWARGGMTKKPPPAGCHEAGTVVAMPELPEVESVRGALADLVGGEFAPGRTSKYPRYAGAGSAAGTLRDVRRRGKWLILGFDAGSTQCELVAHLGMTGKFLVTGAPLDVPHLHASWTVTFPDGDERWLGYVDSRRFGRLVIVEPGLYGTIRGLAEIGPEGTDAGASAAALRQARSSHRSVKAVLLDQRVVAGVGNIYCDEALFASRIHPERAICDLTSSECRELARNLARILLGSIQAGGTTFRDYRKPDGSRGENVANLRCYGRSGLPCQRCGEELRASVVAGRGSTHCPRCQH